MPTGQDLADALSGAGGSPVNRTGLNAFVATSQARNGLVSAQTQDALIKASQAQEQAEARDKYKNDLIAMGAPESEATLFRDAAVGSQNGDAVTALKALGQAKLGYGTPQSQTAGQQMFEGKVAPPVAVPNDSIMPPGSGLAGQPVNVSPTGQAQIDNLNATAGLHNAQADAGGFNPHTATGAAATPEGQAALARAVSEGRLDPTRVNSRTAPILAQMELNTPGTNYNRLHADAVLQSNAAYQQKAMSVDMLPGLLSHVTQLGKKLNGGAGYSDLKSVGTMQQWINGQTNDPDYQEYMTARNDTLLRLAGVMRGVGMSDQAHTAEVEAMAPTLAPYALDAWLKGQMAVVNPLLERQNRITHLGEQGQGTAKLNAPPAVGAQQIPSYPDEQSAIAAGHKPGDRVNIGGVNGTLQ